MDIVNHQITNNYQGIKFIQWVNTLQTRKRLKAYLNKLYNYSFSYTDDELNTNFNGRNIYFLGKFYSQDKSQIIEVERYQDLNIKSQKLDTFNREIEKFEAMSRKDYEDISIDILDYTADKYDVIGKLLAKM